MGLPSWVSPLTVESRRTLLVVAVSSWSSRPSWFSTEEERVEFDRSTPESLRASSDSFIWPFLSLMELAVVTKGFLKAEVG